MAGFHEDRAAAGEERLARSRWRRWVAFLVLAALGAGLAAGSCEMCFRVLERATWRQCYSRGAGGKYLPDERWGWKPAPGMFEQGTPEFQIKGGINDLWMNDDPFDPAQAEGKTRILALGDSHTYAVGASTGDAWPKVLERKLNALPGGGGVRVCNAGMVGYSLHQYLLRLIDQGPVVRPRCVVLGLSYATDFYDLLPPDHGGWIYGGNMARHYFDFDAEGRLVERVWRPPQAGEAAKGREFKPVPAQAIRLALDKLATFRFLRRSKLALFLGSRLQVGGQTLWPNMDVVLEKEVSAKHRYQNRLAEALLLRIREECARQGARLVIAGIPYLPQVYDDIWAATFGDRPDYSRTAAIERVTAFCRREGIPYVDTLDAFRSATRERGRWLHYRSDAHPTPEGHELIAGVIVASGAIQPGGAK